MQPGRQSGARSGSCTDPVKLLEPARPGGGRYQVDRRLERATFWPAGERLKADHLQAGGVDQRLEDGADVVAVNYVRHEGIYR